ncbi:MAG: lysylphosphatidylglycerol synthase transmembrane domain-containing protein [Chloroflexota bacterium]
MIAENKQERPSSRSTSRKLFSWLNVLLGIILVGWGLWYIAREITFSEIAKAMSVANIPLILLAFLVVLFTQAIKAWRWQLLFFPKESNLTFSAAFWAVMLGQFVNTAVSFLRLGELARIYALYQQTKISKIRSLGTLVLEKTLELITLVVTLAVLIPFVVVPRFHDGARHHGRHCGSHCFLCPLPARLPDPVCHSHPAPLAANPTTNLVRTAAALGSLRP